MGTGESETSPLFAKIEALHSQADCMCTIIGRLLAGASTSTRRALGLEEVAVVQGGPSLTAISTTGEPADALWEEARDAPGPQLLLCDLQESAGKGSLPLDP